MKKFKTINQRGLGKALTLSSKKVGKEVLRHFEKNYDKRGFENEEGTFKRWKRRSSSNENKKPILKDTGRLRKGFKLKVEKDGFSIENPIPYAQFIQQGNDKLVARPIIEHSEKIDEIIVDQIDKAIFKLLGF